MNRWLGLLVERVHGWTGSCPRSRLGLPRSRKKDPGCISDPRPCVSRQGSV